MALPAYLILSLLCLSTPSFASPENRKRSEVTVVLFPAISALTEIIQNSNIDGFDVAQYESSTVWSVAAKRALGDENGTYDPLTLHVTTYPAENRQIITYVPNEPASSGAGIFLTTEADCTIVPYTRATCVTGLPEPTPAVAVRYDEEDFQLYTTFIVTGDFDGTIGPIGGGYTGGTEGISETTIHETTTRTPRPSRTVTETETDGDTATRPGSTGRPTATNPDAEPTADESSTEFSISVIPLPTTVPTNIPSVTRRPPAASTVPNSATRFKPVPQTALWSCIVVGWLTFGGILGQSYG